MPFVRHQSIACRIRRAVKAVHNQFDPFITAFGIACSGLLLGLTTDGVAADSVPKYNLSRTCEAAANGSVSAGRDKEACVGDERAARDQAAKNWSQYSVRDKNDCVGMESKGGPPSYVELLSCLEIMKDSRKIHHDELAQPLLNGKGAVDTQSIPLTDLGEGDLATPDRAKAHRGHKRKHQQARSQ